MKKYHLIFTDRLGRRIIEYETDIEPPNMGDIIQFGSMIKDDAIYVVYDRWYRPRNEDHVEITFSLDVSDEGPLQ